MQAVARSETEAAEAVSRLERVAGLLQEAGSSPLLADKALHDSLARGARNLAESVRALRAQGLGDDLKIRPRL